MTASLEELRARLKEKMNTQGGSNQSSGGFDLRYYPFFHINVGETATLRFIADKDESNFDFWREKAIYDWTFASPDEPGESVRIKIPCRNMYEEKTDPVLQTLSSMYNAGGEEKKKASALWVKRSYLYQGFVRKSNLEEEEVPENPIRVFDLSKTLHKKVLTSLLEEDEELMLPSNPIDLENGLNFLVKKTKDGEYNSYDQSGFSMRPTPLTDDELAALEQYGPFDLKSLLPNLPSDEAYALLPEMVEAHVNGEPWNKDWEEYWKPFGSKKPTEEGATRSGGTSRKKQAPMVDEMEEETTSSDSSSDDDAPATKTSAQDVIAKLKAKRAAKG
jgi:hypothetical protein